ncbi:MAG: MATE family efflux transporter, partial [Gemmatimonadales bacterium]
MTSEPVGSEPECTTPPDAAAPPPVGGAAAAAPRPSARYDRSIVSGPLVPAVWMIAWPTMLTNIFGGLQGIVDHVLVGHLIGYTANAAIGVAWQILLVVIVFVSSLYTGASVLVARFAGAGDEARVDRVV